MPIIRQTKIFFTETGRLKDPSARLKSDLLPGVNQNIDLNSSYHPLSAIKEIKPYPNDNTRKTAHYTGAEKNRIGFHFSNQIYIFRDQNFLYLVLEKNGNDINKIKVKRRSNGNEVFIYPDEISGSMSRGELTSYTDDHTI